jgi:hypothetical protein
MRRAINAHIQGGIAALFVCKDNHMDVIRKVLTNGPKDYENVHKVQDGNLIYVI